MSRLRRPHPDLISRRESLRRVGCAAVAGLFANAGARCLAESNTASAAPAKAITFSFGTYGMKAITTENAIRIIAEIGYDGIEIAARPGWDAEPSRMPTQRRKSIRSILDDSGLQLNALMEHLYPSTDEAEHLAGLERLRRVADLGKELSPGPPPLIQSVLGGGQWEKAKAMLLDRLGDWRRVAEQTETVIAIKPHRGGVVSRPAEAVWLIDRLDKTPWIRMVYDYSHYSFRDMPLDETIKTALPYTAHIAIKDSMQAGDKVRFGLPGAHGFDYVPLFRQFFDGGYRGDICCEVSSMVSTQSNYDPIAAAKSCYANIAPIFKRAGVPRSNS